MPYRVEGLPKAQQVAVGHDFSCVLDLAGLVHCFGNHDRGYFGEAGKSGPEPITKDGLPPIEFLAVGSMSSIYAIDQDGQVWSYGSNFYNELGRDGSRSTVPAVVKSLPPMHNMFASTFHACGFSRAGSLFCFGNNSYQQIGYDSPSSNSLPTRVDLYPYFGQSLVSSKIDYGSPTQPVTSSASSAAVSLANPSTVTIKYRQDGQVSNASFDQVVQLRTFSNLSYLAFAEGALPLVQELAERREDQDYLVYQSGGTYSYRAIAGAYPAADGSGDLTVLLSTSDEELRIKASKLVSKGVGLVFAVAPDELPARLFDQPSILTFQSMAENIWSLPEKWHHYLYSPLHASGASPDGKLRACQRSTVYSDGIVVYGPGRLSIDLSKEAITEASLQISIADQGPICRYATIDIIIRGYRNGEPLAPMASLTVSGDAEPTVVNLDLDSIDELVFDTASHRPPGAESLASQARWQLSESLLITYVP